MWRAQLTPTGVSFQLWERTERESDRGHRESEDREKGSEEEEEMKKYIEGEIRVESNVGEVCVFWGDEIVER